MANAFWLLAVYSGSNQVFSKNYASKKDEIVFRTYFFASITLKLPFSSLEAGCRKNYEWYGKKRATQKTNFGAWRYLRNFSKNSKNSSIYLFINLSINLKFSSSEVWAWKNFRPISRGKEEKIFQRHTRNKTMFEK